MKKLSLLLLTSASLAFAAPAHAGQGVMDANGFINEARVGAIWA